MTDPYSVLGITPGADDETIKKAYRQKCKQYHPDLHPNDPTAEEHFKEVQAAYSEIMRMKQGGGQNRQNNSQNQRRQRRQHDNNRGNREVQPSVSREELAKLKVAELREKAAELNLDVTGLKKAELVEAVFEASVKA